MEQGVLEQQVVVGAGASLMLRGCSAGGHRAAGVKYRLVRVGVTASIPLNYNYVFNLRLLVDRLRKEAPSLNHFFYFHVPVPDDDQEGDAHEGRHGYGKEVELLLLQDKKMLAQK